MEAKQCPRGHFYDPEKYAFCPECAKEGASETVPIGGTMPLEGGAYEPVPPTQPVDAGAPPAFPRPDPGATVPADAGWQGMGGMPGMANQPFEEFGATGRIDEANLGFVPTVGWVICIRGPHKGQDFRLLTGYNKIGRNADMSISLPSDEQVTRDSHAVIAYEPQSRKFFAAGDKNMIYLNGTFMMGMQELHPNDVIKVGTTELMFVPLCGEVFNWD